MASTITKRQQARNERILQDLLKSVPGNDRCADCGARNPAWASWSLGIFLCMSCAALHRKMGTHISKVKSLSMDSWAPDQVDNMKSVGNAISNRTFNPQNVKPDIPTDADEVSGVMERFIRQKYEQRAFMASRPRAQTAGNASVSSFEDKPPPLPPKPGKKFGFSLGSRSVSATQQRYTPPLSPALTGSDGRSTPQLNKPSRVFGSTVGNQDDDDNFDVKLASLREMGFPDTRRNSMVLKSVNGSLERAIEALVRLGDTATASGTLTPISANSAIANGIQIERQRPQQKPAASSANPFDALDLQPPRRAVTQPVPLAASAAYPQQPAQQPYNPFLPAAPQPQPQPQLHDSFGGLQISNLQPQQFQSQNNPFMPQQPQQPMQPPAYLLQNPSYQQPQVASNPFLRKTQSQTFTPSNPFGLQQAPAPQNPWLSQPEVQTPQAFYQPQQDFFSTQPQQNQLPSQFPPQQTQQPYQQPQPLQPQHTANPYLQSQQSASNPFQVPAPQPQQPEPYQSYQAPPQQQQQQQQPAQPQFYQPTGPQSRFDKNSILNLYNYPQLAPSRPLQSLPEGGAPEPAAISAVPQRSVTMPATGTMNPFAASSAPQPHQQATMDGGVGRHVSRESVAFVGLGSGRQSPDAFASLSARYAR